MSARMVKIGFGIWCVLILGFLIVTKPPRQSAQDKRAESPLSAFGDLRIAFETSPLTAPQFTFRGGPQRLGVHDASFIKLPLSESWRTRQINHGIHNASKSTPAVDDSGVYVGSDAGWFLAFDHSGRGLWRVNIETPDRGFHGTAALDSTTVYIGGYNGRLYAFDKATGHLRWFRQMAEAIGTAPLFDKNELLVSAETNRPRRAFMAAIDPRDGRMHWTTEWLKEQTHSSPAVSEDGERVFLGANDGKFYAFARNNGRKLWEADLRGAVKGTPAVIGDRVYVTSWGKSLFALDAAAGTIAWESPLIGISQSSVTHVPDRDILVVNSHLRSAVYGFQRQTGKELWRIPTGNWLSMGSAVAVRPAAGQPYYVLIGCYQKTLCAIDPRSGKILQQINLPGDLTGAPTLYQDKVYVATDNGPLVQFTGAH